MVVIRLARAGTKKRPFFHVVVADKAAARDGRYLERLGIYNPKASPDVAKGSGQEFFSCDLDRLNAWVAKGAQVSETVGHLVSRTAQ